MRKCVKRHYFERFNAMEPPSDIPQREFGYMGADSGTVRHIRLRNVVDLRVPLLRAAPPACTSPMSGTCFRT